MNIHEFEASLALDFPPENTAIPLKALWFDGKGNWAQAHNEVDHLNDSDSALVHAYLHRKEGDNWNADYWYRKARETRPNMSLQEEWKQLVLRFL